MNEELELSKRIGSDIYMKTSHNGKEIRKAYETKEWKSEEKINYTPITEFTVVCMGLTEDEGTYSLNLMPGEEITFTLSPNNFINIGHCSSNINVATVNIYNNSLKKIKASNPGTAVITIYDSKNSDYKFSINVTVEDNETEEEPTNGGD